MCSKQLPDSKVHGVYMGPTWGRQDPGEPHVGPMNLATRAVTLKHTCFSWLCNNAYLSGAAQQQNPKIYPPYLSKC